MKSPTTIRFIERSELLQLLELYDNHLFDAADLPRPAGIELDKVWNEICGNPRIRYFGVFHNRKLVSSCALAVIPNLPRGASPYGLIDFVGL